MSQRRYEITDYEWSIMSPLLPDRSSAGAEPADPERIAGQPGGSAN